MIITNEDLISNIHHNMEALEKDHCVLDKVPDSGITYWKIYESAGNRILHIDATAHPEFGKFYDFE